jgi:hypothetical protein
MEDVQDLLAEQEDLPAGDEGLNGTAKGVQTPIDSSSPNHLAGVATEQTTQDSLRVIGADSEATHTSGQWRPSFLNSDFFTSNESHASLHEDDDCPSQVEDGGWLLVECAGSTNFLDGCNTPVPPGTPSARGAGVGQLVYGLAAAAAANHPAARDGWQERNGGCPRTGGGIFMSGPCAGSFPAPSWPASKYFVEQTVEQTASEAAAQLSPPVPPRDKALHPPAQAQNDGTPSRRTRGSLRLSKKRAAGEAAAEAARQ